MFGGKLINNVCSNSIKTLIKILYKKYQENQLIIQILKKITKMFLYLSKIDSLLFKLFISLKSTPENKKLKKTLLMSSINLPIISNNLVLITLLFLPKFKISKTLKVDILIIKDLLLSCYLSNFKLIKTNINLIKSIK